MTSAARTETNKFTAYISPYLVVSNGGNYSKHIYMGSQRITSKLSSSDIFAESPVNDTLQAKYDLQTTKIKERFDSLGVAYNGTQQSGGLISSTPLQGLGVYFYHSDHLGSSSLITDDGGNLVQHIEYVPFGEVFVEERNSSWSTPYKFNGKELDEETGLYYYSARYYDPRTSIWLSVDPLAEKYMNMSSYVYCADNPVKFVDPDGRVIIPVHGTWSNKYTWKNRAGITKACGNLFGDKNIGQPFPWTGGNYVRMRTSAAKALINDVRNQLADKGNSEPVTLVGHSHGGNVSIEAINLMVEMGEFKDVKFNLLTINTPVRKDYQLSENAQKRTTHVNVYDSQDPVQSNGGNSIVILPDNQSDTFGTGEYGPAGRTYPHTQNIEVNNPQGITEAVKIGGRSYITTGDFHNSHNRVDDWIDKTKTKAE